MYLTAGIDSQRNRYEMYVWGWAPGEEAFLIDKQIIMGRHDDEDTLQRVDAVINKKYRHADGTDISISRICWDIGGIDAEIVYKRSKNTAFSACCLSKGPPFTENPLLPCLKTQPERGIPVRNRY